jgi:hypothetical protein
MNAQLIATLIDQSLSVSSGIIAMLIGFRVFGPKPGANQKFDSLHTKWLKHLKWFGPLLIVIASIQLIVSVFAGSSSTGDADSKQKMLQALQENLSAEGKLADHDQVIQAPEGFRVLIPEGYTYSKPPGTPLSLAAEYDINGAATPAISVFVTKLDDRLDRFIENTKAILNSRNKTTKFSETQVTETNHFKLYRTTMTSQRDGRDTKGGMLFFESEGKVFILTYGTHEELFNANAPVFEKIIRSFGP